MKEGNRMVAFWTDDELCRNAVGQLTFCYRAVWETCQCGIIIVNLELTRYMVWCLQERTRFRLWIEAFIT